MKVSINTNLNEEQLQRIKELFGSNPETFEGKEIEIENESIVNELEKRKILVVDRGKGNDEIQQSPEEKISEEIENNDSNEIKNEGNEEKKHNEDKPLNEEQKKEVAQMKEIVENAINNLRFPNDSVNPMDTAYIKSQLLNEYCSNSNRLYWHFNENNFLENTNVASLLESKGVRAEDIHRGLQKAFYQNQDMPKDEISTTSVNVVVPPEREDKKVGGMGREQVKKEMADVVKARINTILNSNDRPDRILIEIKNMQNWVERNKDSIAQEVGSDISIRDFAQEICFDEIKEIVKEANDNNIPVQLSLKNVNMENPKEREEALALIKEVKASGVDLESIDIKFDIAAPSDIDNAVEIKEELEAAGIDADINVTSDDPDLQQEAEEELGNSAGVAETAGAIVGTVVAEGIARMATGLENPMDKEQNIDMEPDELEFPLKP